MLSRIQIFTIHGAIIGEKKSFFHLVGNDDAFRKGIFVEPSTFLGTLVPTIGRTNSNCPSSFPNLFLEFGQERDLSMVPILYQDEIQWNLDIKPKHVDLERQINVVINS